MSLLLSTTSQYYVGYVQGFLSGGLIGWILITMISTFVEDSEDSDDSTNGSDEGSSDEENEDSNEEKEEGTTSKNIKVYSGQEFKNLLEKFFNPDLIEVKDETKDEIKSHSNEERGEAAKGENMVYVEKDGQYVTMNLTDKSFNDYLNMILSAGSLKEVKSPTDPKKDKNLANTVFAETPELPPGSDNNEKIARETFYKIIKENALLGTMPPQDENSSSEDEMTGIFNKLNAPISPSSGESSDDSNEGEGEATIRKRVVSSKKRTIDSTNGRDEERVLEVGRKIGEQPIAYPSSTSGGYATMSQIEDYGKKHRQFNSVKMTPQEEKSIMKFFEYIKGMNYYAAEESVQRKGYKLHPLYVLTESQISPESRRESEKFSTEKMPASCYSGTTLGVRIVDEDFGSTDEYIGNGIDKPSGNAKIVDIIDVGGMDYENRGLVDL